MVVIRGNKKIKNAWEALHREEGRVVVQPPACLIYSKVTVVIVVVVHVATLRVLPL